MIAEAVAEVAALHHLDLFGQAPSQPGDDLGDGTIFLLGPREPGFWPFVTSQPEFRDGGSDPLDRWSRRAGEAMAHDLRARALYPFGDPVRPFMSWALRSGRAFSSPVGLLVHDRAGLLVSFRVAIFLAGIESETSDSASPCEDCAGRPCLTACPPRALTAEGYDLAACHGYLDTRAGQSCMTRGCLVRLACPLSRSYGRERAQSAFHMEAFHT